MAVASIWLARRASAGNRNVRATFRRAGAANRRARAEPTARAPRAVIRRTRTAFAPLARSARSGWGAFSKRLFQMLASIRAVRRMIQRFADCLIRSAVLGACLRPIAPQQRVPTQATDLVASALAHAKRVRRVAPTTLLVHRTMHAFPVPTESTRAGQALARTESLRPLCAACRERFAATSAQLARHSAMVDSVDPIRTVA
jgi:hypothetical protein